MLKYGWIVCTHVQHDFGTSSDTLDKMRRSVMVAFVYYVEPALCFLCTTYVVLIKAVSDVYRSLAFFFRPIHRSLHQNIF